MNYRITIERYDPNPAYNAEEEERRMRRGNWDNAPSQQAFLQCTVLNMEVTAEQFDAIRKAALEVCK
jgi:NTP pyrophosphatase (non-canonical NTP hydrolase)